MLVNECQMHPNTKFLRPTMSQSRDMDPLYGHKSLKRVRRRYMHYIYAKLVKFIISNFYKLCSDPFISCHTSQSTFDL